MKKLLLATAAIALIAPAAQAEIKLDLGGYFKGYAGYSNQDISGLKKFDLKRKSQVAFTGETTLDNGLTVGYHGTLFQENNSGEAVGVADPSGDTVVTQGNRAAELERSYLYFSGNWGRVNLGRENGAAYLLQVSAPGADANIDGQDISFSFYNADLRQDYKHTSGVEQYSDKVTYLTPKFNGFQAGVSYSQDGEQKTTDKRFGMEPKDSDFFKNIWEVAARYDGEFSGVGVHAGAGYSHASEDAATDDFKAYNLGLKFTVDAFGFGGVYLNEDAEDANYDARTWVLGADYTYGAYNFGVSYFNTKEKTSDAKLQRYTLGAGYTFGPGMKFNGTVGYYDANSAAGNNDATVVTIGTDIQF